MEHFAPQARQDGLVIEELPDEVLIYDTARHKAHCLNPTAAMVWKHCDGKTTVPAMTRLLEGDLKAPVDEAVVWHALDQLDKFHLLQERVVRPVDAVRMTRRELVRKVGVGFAVAVVTSIVAPTASQAATAQQPSYCNATSENGQQYCEVTCAQGTATCIPQETQAFCFCS